MWATCNIGANSPEEAGLYFAWGETQGYTAEQVGSEEGKRAFTWDDYKFGPKTAPTKYNETDGLMVLEPEDDAATVNWGEGWRMPTKAEFEELMSGTTSAWTVSDDGISGVTFTSTKNGNTLFFPAVGSAWSGSAGSVGIYGNFWSSSLRSGRVFIAWKLDFGSGSRKIYSNGRYLGYSVRPVRL